MEFKVGDRVEVLKPAQGTGFSQKNNIGRGTVEAINDDVSEVCVRVDTNNFAWWYDIESVRPLTPSITVGTQVRLTGVVVNSTEKDCWVTVNGADVGQEGILIFDAPFEALEVIRQPFKRGEVVYRNDTKYVTVEDEEGGSVKLTTAFIGAEVFLAVASDFERRP